MVQVYECRAPGTTQSIEVIKNYCNIQTLHFIHYTNERWLQNLELQRKLILLTEFMELGTAVHLQQSLHTFSEVNPQCGMLMKCTVVLHDNMPAHTATYTNGLTQASLQIADFDYSPYSLNLSLCDNNPFIKINVSLAIRNFATNKELKEWSITDQVL